MPSIYAPELYQPKRKVDIRKHDKHILDNKGICPALLAIDLRRNRAVCHKSPTETWTTPLHRQSAKEGTCLPIAATGAEANLASFVTPTSAGASAVNNAAPNIGHRGSVRISSENSFLAPISWGLFSWYLTST
jgi:hypothetical protein